MPGRRLISRGVLVASSAIISTIGGSGLFVTVMALAAPSSTDFDAKIAHYARAMLEECKKTFRYETFGSEAFWGDTLQLHKAIAGEKNGGIGLVAETG